MATAGKRRHAKLGTAMVMTVMLAGARAAGGPADSARVMMVMMQVKITDGGETRAADGPAARSRVMMMVVLIKIRSTRPTSLLASTRAARDPTGRTRVMMMTVQVKIADGGETHAAGGTTVRARAMDVMMVIKIRRTRPASLSAPQT